MRDSRPWSIASRALQLAVGLALVFCIAAAADSIWARRDRTAAFLFQDNLAANEGDSLTVLVQDQSSFNVEGERDSEKTTAQTGSIGISTPLGGLTWPPEDSKQESTRTFGGSHEYNGTREFADSVTVTVVDRLPNGNMVVAGRSERHIAGESTLTILTGIVKPEDVSGSNTVSSTRVAHLKVYYETTGPAGDYLREGWLSKIVNLLWPF